jgi:hypothetical protein
MSTSTNHRRILPRHRELCVRSMKCLDGGQCERPRLLMLHDPSKTIDHEPVPLDDP